MFINKITLTGFMFMVACFVYVTIMSPTNFDYIVPEWFCFAFGISLFIYLTLDNADGIQARTTGNSSPLGLLFDHGCDALNLCLSGISFFHIINYNYGYITLIMFILMLYPFYYANLEHKITGELILPIINPCNEGFYFIIGLSIFSGIKGVNYWTNEGFISGYKNNEILVYFSMTIFSILVLAKLYNKFL